MKSDFKWSERDLDGHHPIIYMQCGPVRFFFSPKKAAKFSQLQHKAIPRLTNFFWNGSENGNTIHDIYCRANG